MATRGGAEALQISEDVGPLEVGKKDDIILLNLDQPHLQPTHDLFQTVITSASVWDVSDMIVDGIVLMKDRQLIILVEEEICTMHPDHLKAIAAQAGLS
jgi:5-methylthioadenosine/S-adenosylhomocysteine deaminase